MQNQGLRNGVKCHGVPFCAFHFMDKLGRWPRTFVNPPASLSSYFQHWLLTSSLWMSLVGKPPPSPWWAQWQHRGKSQPCPASFLASASSDPREALSVKPHMGHSWSWERVGYWWRFQKLNCGVVSCWGYWETLHLTPQVLCSVLGPSLQEGHGGARECPEKGNETGEGSRE